MWRSICGARAAKVSSGYVTCQCDLPDMFNERYNWVQYVEHENKGVLVEYKSDSRASGFEKKPYGHGVAEKCRDWFHMEIKTEVPKPIRSLDVSKPGREWQDKGWHVTNWIYYTDPYDRSKSRLRYWRRVEKLSDAEIAELEEKAAKEETERAAMSV